MLIVYVKHYLTPVGIVYFQKEWFPKVHTASAEQEGFVSLEYFLSQEESDLVDITLKFQDEERLEAWCAVPLHDILRDELYQFRSRGYWLAVRTLDENTDPSKLEWRTIKRVG